MKLIKRLIKLGAESFPKSEDDNYWNMLVTEAQLQALVAEQVALAVGPLLDGFRGVRVMDQDNLRIVILYCGVNYARAAIHTLLDMHEREQQEQKGGDE